MNLLMTSTDIVVTVDGAECRVWNAVTENNTQCFVFVHRVAVRNAEDQNEFAELYPFPATEVEILEGK
jgi:hypothetical protein